MKGNMNKQTFDLTSGVLKSFFCLNVCCSLWHHMASKRSGILHLYGALKVRITQSIRGVRLRVKLFT